MRAGFIGAGKVGFTLGKYLAMHGIEISGYYSRTPASAKEAAEFTQSRYYTSIEEITKDRSQHIPHWADVFLEQL